MLDENQNIQITQLEEEIERLKKDIQEWENSYNQLKEENKRLHQVIRGMEGSEMTNDNTAILEGMMPVYGCIDVKHGREVRYLYSEEEAWLYFGTIIYDLTEDPWYYCDGDTYVCKLQSLDDIKNFLSEAPEVDLDDPKPIDLAEYSLSFDEGIGNTHEIAELLDQLKIFNRYESDPRLEELLAAGYPMEELYNKDIRDSDIRFNEIMKIFESGGDFHDVLSVTREEKDIDQFEL